MHLKLYRTYIKVYFVKIWGFHVANVNTVLESMQIPTFFLIFLESEHHVPYGTERALSGPSNSEH